MSVVDSLPPAMPWSAVTVQYTIITVIYALNVKHIDVALTLDIYIYLLQTKDQ